MQSSSDTLNKRLYKSPLYILSIIGKYLRDFDCRFTMNSNHLPRQQSEDICLFIDQ